MITEWKITGNINQKLDEKLEQNFLGVEDFKSERIKDGILAISSTKKFWRVWDAFLLIITMFSLLDDVYHHKYKSLEYPFLFQWTMRICFYFDLFFNFFRAKSNHKKEYQYLRHVSFKYFM